ncbi:acyltransferase [Pseudomonas sp. 39167]|uniref:acyltransferase n=1 Tax=Pseudomonas sp. 39167 TaxID=2967215 RepID=UPI0023646A01|nr:acyltransferase family protein [Pseudomonas sp. 39167]MDD2031067.1 acyltransferase family protein [Pseudomonas sp. 39167]
MDARIAKLKLYACFLVILLHVSAGQAGIWGEGWWAAHIFQSFSRACVPIFLMISGALLLKKVEPLHIFLKKRFIRVFPPLLFWSVFYVAWLWYCNVDISGWFVRLFTAPAMYHLWYLYAIIGLYALTPILRLYYKNGSMPEKLWGISIWAIVSSIWPTASILLNPQACTLILPSSTASFYHLSTFSGYFGFLLLGAVLSDIKISTKIGAIMFISGSIGTAAAMYWHSQLIGRPCETFYDYLSPLVIFSAVGFFCCLMSSDSHPPTKWVAQAADCTLGIYCLHVLIIGGIFPVFGLSATGINTWFMAPLISIAAFLVSFFIIYAVRLTALGRYVT